MKFCGNDTTKVEEEKHANAEESKKLPDKSTSSRSKSTSDVESNCTEDAEQRFGVRSYLHHFYEDCAGVALCRKELIVPDEIEKKQKRKRLALCVTCVAGLLLAISGLVILLCSFAGTIEDDDFGKVPEWENYVMMICGASVFCVGGIIVAICVVLIGIGIIEIKQELLERNEFQERLWRGLSIKQTSQSDSPRRYDVTAVQPLLHEEPHDVTQHVTHPGQSTTVSSQ